MANGKWYKSSYKYRSSITLDASNVGSATHDFEVKVPDDWDFFWDNTRSDFKDVVVTNEFSKKVDFDRKDDANHGNTPT
jgi:hypothetical protein